MERTLKILVAYHKKAFLLKNSVFTPIHVGRNLAIQRISQSNEELQWLLANMIGDDEGENLSSKNNIYNEITSIYWAWKNYAKLGNPDYIGFMHYRRHLVFDKTLPKRIYECSSMSEDYCDQIKFDERKILTMLGQCDFVCPKPHWRKSLYEQYRTNHEIGDLDKAIEILKEKYPEFSKSADKYLNGHDAYFCNMFIFPKEIFFRYASWLFDIVFELEARIDFSGRRMFFSEWLTGIYITYLIEQGKRPIFLPMMFVEERHEIPIAMAIDNDHMYQMIVAIVSLMRTAKENTSYKIYLLLSEDVNEEDVSYIEQLCNNSSKCSCELIKIHRDYDEVNEMISHIPHIAYCQLHLSSLLKGVKKCIYLSTDVVVKEDLSSLFSVNLDDRYLAGVRDFEYLCSRDIKNSKNAIKTNISSEYVDVGVLSINLDKIRTNRLEDKFTTLLKEKSIPDAQSILNCGCFGKIRHVPFAYNVMTKYPLHDDLACHDPYLSRWVEEKEWKAGRKRPRIIQYIGKKKPWKDFSTFYAKDWWDIAKTLPRRMVVEIIAANMYRLLDSALKLDKELTTSLNREVSLKKSISFRTGRTITWLPRKLRGGSRCLHQHGAIYTLKRLCWHVSHLK